MAEEMIEKVCEKHEQQPESWNRLRLKLESPELKLGSYCSRPRPVTHRASAYELIKVRDG